MSETVFDFESGNLSLDFANTNEWHASANPTEHILSFNDLITWGQQSGLVSSDLAVRLDHLAASQPEQAEAVYSRAIQLRESLYRIFSSLYAAEPIPQADLNVLNAHLREAMAHMQLAPAGGELRWEWAARIDTPDLILWSVARAAAELLTSEKASLLRECEDDRGCGYLFIDQTKNHSRRWCSMTSCGNRAKARRHYERVK
jgi:predicted RNA-binding Zn ribbon-like protein